MHMHISFLSHHFHSRREACQVLVTPADNVTLLMNRARCWWRWLSHSWQTMQGQKDLLRCSGKTIEAPRAPWNAAGNRAWGGASAVPSQQVLARLDEDMLLHNRPHTCRKGRLAPLCTPGSDRSDSPPHHIDRRKRSSREVDTPRREIPLSAMHIRCLLLPAGPVLVLPTRDDPGSRCLSWHHLIHSC